MNAKEKECLSNIEEKIDMIIRGVYGDEKNNVKGLLDKMEDTEQNWEKLSPVLDSVEDYSRMINTYRFFTSRRTLYTVSAIVGAATTIILNWDKIKLIL